MCGRGGLLIALVTAIGFSVGANAGAFFGAEGGNGDQSLLFAGVQTEGNLFAGLFAGVLNYKYAENNQDIEVESKTITPSAGYRFAGPVAISIAVGATWEEKIERRLVTETGHSSSAFAQLGAFYWRPEKTGEFLLSYTERSQFFWSRIRGKHRIFERVFAGGEAFKMGNEDVDTMGVGALLERQWMGFSSTFKVGMNDTSGAGRGAYGGLEFYIPF